MLIRFDLKKYFSELYFCVEKKTLLHNARDSFRIMVSLIFRQKHATISAYPYISMNVYKNLPKGGAFNRTNTLRTGYIWNSKNAQNNFYP